MSDAEALLADLDPDQRAAVTTESRLVAVIAGAGSGKTRVLTRRIAYRLAGESADGRHTLALTFTREAAGELRRRLRSLGLREPVEAGTFHSVMLRVLEERYAATDRRRPTVAADRRRLIRDAIDASDRRAVPTFLAEIDWASARGIAARDYAAAARRSGRRPSTGVERAAAVFADVEQLKRRRGVIDFDDVLGLTVREMRRHPEFAEALRWRFRHVLVDESQDLNPLQHALVDALRAGRDDLFLVGDPAQSIYGFNGADPALLVDVERRFPGIEVIQLRVNHRCTPQVVGAGVHALERSGQPFELRSARADGPAVRRHTADDEQAEGVMVVDALKTLERSQLGRGDVAVLARTNAQLDPLRNAIEAAGLPVRQAVAESGPGSIVRQVAALGGTDRLRAFAHDTLDTMDAPDRSAQSTDVGTDRSKDERAVAAAVLEYLREQPGGDGRGFRAWVATNDPFGTGTIGGVELLTFHAAKGREWRTVIVTGVETGLVPHKSASTQPARAEEARLLYVALTRATDELVISGAARRGGYARRPSPLLDGLQLDAPAPAPPPRRTRRLAPDPVTASLRAWRDDAARRARVLPSAWLSDRDLAAIAAERPRTAEELEAVTSLGPITARRLAPQIDQLL
ncbi:MAG: ATP-dependent DNA helicase UvrD2 [Ilumatobacteraceae bacterium]|nr:ATP-dependent DNA helicase UvrD2 [Ilumatobacteraceae bacterium]